jgi:hypothetical protein
MRIVDRDTYHKVADGEDYPTARLLDCVRIIFVEGIEAFCPKSRREEVVEEANRLWEECYKRRAKARLGLLEKTK